MAWAMSTIVIFGLMSSIPNTTDSMAWAMSTIVIFGSICAKSTVILEGVELCRSTKLLVVDYVFSPGKAHSMIGQT